MKIFKSAVIVLCAIFSICFAATAVMIIKENVSDFMINDNVESLVRNIKYKDSHRINGLPLSQYQTTGGYASIETVSEYFGYDSLTEQTVRDSGNKKFSAPTNIEFYKAIRRELPDYQVTQYANLKNTEMIDKIYNSLANNMPAVICFAADDKKNPGASEQNGQSEQKWALHYGVAAGIDMISRTVTVNDEYGNTAEYSIDDFLKATRFESYENMDFYLRLKIAFGLFNENTIYIIDQPEDISDVSATNTTDIKYVNGAAEKN